MATPPEDCGFMELDCKAGNAARAFTGDAIANMALAVSEAVGKAVASLGTVWVHIGTPDLTGGGGGSPVRAGAVAAGAGNVTRVLGYVTWVSLVVALVSLVFLGAVVATRMRRGEGGAAVGRIGVVLGAVVLIGAASGIVSGVLSNGPAAASGTVAFLQSSLWWYMGGAAVLSVIIGATRMAWEGRAEPGRDVLRSLMTLIVVAGAGVTIVGLLTSAADSFAVWVINNSLGCDVRAGGACFGENIIGLLAWTSSPTGTGIGPLLLIILGLVAVLASIVQIVLMVARTAMLVILTGILPLAASVTNTEMGRQWFGKAVAWLVAFILYKPAAAIVYAAAFQLTGTDLFTDDGSGMLAILTGLMLMLLALFAMPALMRFVTPMVGALSGAGAGGAGGAVAMGAMAALPTGAIAGGRLAAGARAGSGSGGGSGASSQHGGTGPTGSGGSAGTGGGSSMPAASAPSGGSAGAASGIGSAGSAGAGGAAAGGAAAAAGPAGLAAGAALNAVRAGGQVATGAARSVAERSTGEGEGSHGSR